MLNNAIQDKRPLSHDLLVTVCAATGRWFMVPERLMFKSSARRAKFVHEMVKNSPGGSFRSVTQKKLVKTKLIIFWSILKIRKPFWNILWDLE